MDDNFDSEGALPDFSRPRAGNMPRAAFMKRAAQLGLGAAAVGPLAQAFDATTAHADSVATDAPTTLNVWYSTDYSGKVAQKVAQMFMRKHPNIKVVLTPVAGTGAAQKLLTSVAAGNPPDVAHVDGAFPVSFGARNALLPLDGYIKGSDIKQADFYPYKWAQAQWDGKTYGLGVDAQGINLLFWNKDLFQKAGLDPDRPPTTIAQLDRYMQKLTIKKAGRYSQLGLIPWYGVGQFLSIWVGAFGGGNSLYDAQTHKITANDPHVVKALQWEVDWAKKLGITEVSSFAAGFKTGAADPFLEGKMAMEATGIWMIGQIQKYAPKMRWGIAPLPSVDGRKSMYVAGRYLAIPRGAKNPQAAWEFIQYFCTGEGITTWCDSQSDYPANVPASLQPVFNATPAQRLIASLLPHGYAFPAVPVGDLYWNTLTQAEDQARHSQLSPQAALDQVTQKVQTALNAYIR